MKLISMVLPLALIGLIQSCSSPQSPRSDLSHQTPWQAPENTRIEKVVLKKLNQAVFEVVTPKINDNFVSYGKTLPFHKLDFKERTDKFSSLGTAFYVGNGRFISAAHVFDVHKKDLPREYSIRDSKGKTYRIKTVTKYSQYRDIIEFEAPEAPKTLQPLKIATEVDVGDDVLTVGNAFGEGIAIRSGQISSFTPDETNGEWNYIRYSAPVNPGNSGGPLVLRSGDVVGIVVRRNSNENLNYATPIDEYTKLGSKRAEFFVKNVSYTKHDQSLDEDWKFSAALPSTLSQLSIQAESSFKAFVDRLQEKFYKIHATHLYPQNKNLERYFRSQSYSTFLSYLAQDTSKNWGLATSETKTTDISPSQRIVSDTSSGDGLVTIFFYLEKPKHGNLSQFVSDTKNIHDLVLRSHGWSRTLAGENIPILSYGKAQRVKMFNDKHERPWTLATWRTGFDYRTVQMLYHAVPDGVVGAWFYYPTSLESLGFIEGFAENLTTAPLSYNAEIAEWQEYLKLDSKYLPRFFKGTSVHLSPSKQLSVETSEFQTHLSHPNMGPESSLTLFRGFDLKHVQRQIFHGLGVAPQKGKQYFEALVKYNPSNKVNEKTETSWKEMSTQSGQYTGKTFAQNQYNVILSSKLSSTRSPASTNAQVDQLIAFACSSHSSEDTQSMQKSCETLKQAFSWQPKRSEIAER